ncbi:hypothetical protein HH214_18305 [Mucilaginibacter robiniae]|uniref:Uncharacterized protein n=1 Tax=Mucilaginibacter robiniae TaxID=2728022 RepID=A0A7L5E3M4_9SPHI|nr:hypothetical protein [Mucilaginibacter robiniae]QJD97685.1 hypothetical protein HH214_18305 [Mucilaginibacter robiniae]
MIKKFLIRVSIFSIPVILYFVVGEVLLYKYKEDVPVSTVVKKQLSSKKEIYFSRSFFNTPDVRLKTEMMKIKKPDIITLGISVVLQYRDFYFHPYENRFYNGGFMVKNIYDFNSYINMMQKKMVHKPKLIIFGFDPSWIKKDYLNDNKNNVTDPDKDEVLNLNNHVNAIQEILHQFIDGDLNNKPSCLKQAYGMAGMNGTGYRRDGSMHNWNQIENYIKSHHYSDLYNYKEHLKRNTFIYNKPMQVDAKKVAMLLQNFALIKKMRINLIVYCPPLANDFYNYAITNKGFQDIFLPYLSIQHMLIQKGYHVIPFCTPKQLGLTDDYMLDGIHAGEVLASKLFYDYMISNNIKFENLPNLDLSYLKKIRDKKPLCPLAFDTN